MQKLESMYVSFFKMDFSPLWYFAKYVRFFFRQKIIFNGQNSGATKNYRSKGENWERSLEDNFAVGARDCSLEQQHKRLNFFLRGL